MKSLFLTLVVSIPVFAIEIPSMADEIAGQYSGTRCFRIYRPDNSFHEYACTEMSLTLANTGSTEFGASVSVTFENGPLSANCELKLGTSDAHSGLYNNADLVLTRFPVISNSCSSSVSALFRKLDIVVDYRHGDAHLEEVLSVQKDDQGNLTQFHAVVAKFKRK